METLIEIWRFLRVRKKLWLLPIVAAVVLLSGLLMSGLHPVLQPFIYTLF